MFLWRKLTAIPCGEFFVYGIMSLLMATKTKPMAKGRAPKKITINDLAVMVQNGFNSIHSEMDTRFNLVDKKFEAVDRRFEQIESRFDKRFDGIDARFERLESRVKNIETRVENLDTKFDALQSVVVNDHGNRLNAVESDVLKIKIALQNK